MIRTEFMRYGISKFLVFQEIKVNSMYWLFIRKEVQREKNTVKCDHFYFALKYWHYRILWIVCLKFFWKNNKTIIEFDVT